MKRLPRQLHLELSAAPELPLSKSLLNRIQIIRALAEQDPLEVSESDPRDVQLLNMVLGSQKTYYDLEMAGTALRFATAFLSVHTGRAEKEIVLSGSSRMKERPVAPLVDAIRKLGGHIDYTDQPGYPPIRIFPKALKNEGVIYIEGDVSSQFISALLMIGPYVHGGLDLFVRPPVVSMPYIEMTVQLMKKHGVRVERNGTYFRVYEGLYEKLNTSIESDWTSASYWFSLLALSDGGALFLKGLREDSLQGDRALCEYYAAFGVESRFDKDGLHISMQEADHPNNIELDLRGEPDLAQTIVVTCLGRGIPCFITGLQNLRIKETDRLQALALELEKFGAQVEIGTDHIKLIPAVSLPENVWVETYGDHRMAMAFAPMCVRTALKIAGEDVVSKSYPNFWEEWDKILRLDKTRQGDP